MELTTCQHSKVFRIVWTLIDICEFITNPCLLWSRFDIVSNREAREMLYIYYIFLMFFFKDFHIKGTCISFTNYKFPSTLCLLLFSLQYNPLSPTTTNLLYLPIKHSKTCLRKQPNCQVKRLVVSQSNPKAKQITNQYIVLLSLRINPFYSRKTLTVRYISAKDILHCG